MKKGIIVTSLFFVFFSCSQKENISLVGKWKLTEELIDIGDGKGSFREVSNEHFIEFKQDGTFSSTINFCPLPLQNNEKGTGTYSIDKKQLVLANCEEEVKNILSFEIIEKEFILNLHCIEPCKQKYVKII